MTLFDWTLSYWYYKCESIYVWCYGRLNHDVWKDRWIEECTVDQNITVSLQTEHGPSVGFPLMRRKNTFKKQDIWNNACLNVRRVQRESTVDQMRVNHRNNDVQRNTTMSVKRYTKSRIYTFSWTGFQLFNIVDCFLVFVRTVISERFFNCHDIQSTVL